MTFDEIIDNFDADSRALGAMQAALDDWATVGPRARAMLHDYVTGADYSERTERALFTIVHLLGEAADTASFPDLCRLALDPERFQSVLGDDGSVLSYPPILLSTFDGDPAPLYRLIDDPSADELARGDALLVVAYLARTGRMPERDAYDYLAALPARLQPREAHFVWFGYARAVAALGFAGLSGPVESAIARGFVDPDIMQSAGFWEDLRDSQQNPRDVTGPLWAGLEPMGSAAEFIMSLDEHSGEDGPATSLPEPMRNPLRGVGRNDPCPCGSGKKFKKCCLSAAAA